MSHRVVGLEIERAEVNGVVRRVVHSVKRHTHEALPLHVLAPDVELDGAVCELDALQVGDAVVRAGTEMYAGARPVPDTRGRAVEDVEARRIEGPGLTTDSRRGEHPGRGKQQGDGSAPVHGISVSWRYSVSTGEPRFRFCRGDRKSTRLNSSHMSI